GKLRFDADRLSPPVREVGARAEGPGRAFWERKRRDGTHGRIAAQFFRDPVLSEKTRDDRLRTGVTRRRRNRARNVGGAGDERRYEDREYRVNCGIAEEYSQRTFELVGAGAGDEVDRVTDRGVTSDELTQRALCRRGKPRY